MLEFKQLRIEDRVLLEPYLSVDGVVMSDRTFASLYIWREHYKIEWCIRDGFLFIRNGALEQNMYYMPLGKGDIAPAIEQIYQTEAGAPFYIALITEQRRFEIAECLDETAVLDESREEFDYIYNSLDLIELKGKRYQSKRNFINRFLAESEGRYEFCEIDPVLDRVEILDFLDSWINEEHRKSTDYRYERSAIINAIENYAGLGFIGAKLMLDGKMIAFTLAAKQCEGVMDILIEKADLGVVGAYQMINREFAARYCRDVKYINREEDLGLEGLRKAKLSYHPAYLTQKYAAECNRTKA